jgi:transcriptional regulator with XRE-family HTH domain
MELRKPTSRIKRILADNIHCLRKQRGLSQEEFAEMCGLHRTYIGAVEREERNVTLSTLEAIAFALEIDVPTLLHEHPDQKGKRGQGS